MLARPLLLQPLTRRFYWGAVAPELERESLSWLSGRIAWRLQAEAGGDALPCQVADINSALLSVCKVKFSEPSHSVVFGRQLFPYPGDIVPRVWRSFYA